AQHYRRPSLHHFGVSNWNGTNGSAAIPPSTDCGFVGALLAAPSPGYIHVLGFEFRDPPSAIL
ncbi:MAG: hypothetical protein ACREJ6_15855, partial [Candidatus Methylomirabilis sp.]